MASADLCIIYNLEDGDQWVNFICEQLSKEELSFNPIRIPDEELSSSPSPRTREKLKRAKAILIIATPAHWDRLLTQGKGNEYSRYVTNHQRVILFLCGVLESDLTRLKNSKQKPPGLEKWNIVSYSEEERANPLILKTVEVIEEVERSERASSTSKSRKSKKKNGHSIQVFPQTVRCEVATEVVLVLDVEVPEDGDVKVTFTPENSSEAETIRSTRLNAFTYKVALPEHEQSQVRLRAYLDEEQVGSVTVTYQSLMETEDVTFFTSTYTAIIDDLCTQLLLPNNNSVSRDDVDKSVMALLMDVQAIVLENMFGMYQYYIRENSKAELPTLLHLAAKHGLSECVSKLTDLPGAWKAYSILNCDHMTPADLANTNGFHELGRFFDESHEMKELYESMMYPENMGKGAVADDDSYDIAPLILSAAGKCCMEPQSDYMDMNKSCSLPRSQNTQPAAEGRLTNEDGDSPDPEDYEPVDDVLQARRAQLHPKPGEPPVTAEADSPADPGDELYLDLLGAQDHTLCGLAQGMELDFQVDGRLESGSQQELMAIMRQVKDKQITIMDAETLFQDWQMKFLEGKSTSFKDKQARLACMRKELEQIKGKSHEKQGTIFHRLFKSKPKKHECTIEHMGPQFKEGTSHTYRKTSSSTGTKKAPGPRSKLQAAVPAPSPRPRQDANKDRATHGYLKLEGSEADPADAEHSSPPPKLPPRTGPVSHKNFPAHRNIAVPPPFETPTSPLSPGGLESESPSYDYVEEWPFDKGERVSPRKIATDPEENYLTMGDCSQRDSTASSSSHGSRESTTSIGGTTSGIDSMEDDHASEASSRRSIRQRPKSRLMAVKEMLQETPETPPLPIPRRGINASPRLAVATREPVPTPPAAQQMEPEPEVDEGGDADDEYMYVVSTGPPDRPQPRVPPGQPDTAARHRNVALSREPAADDADTPQQLYDDFRPDSVQQASEPAPPTQSKPPMQLDFMSELRKKMNKTNDKPSPAVKPQPNVVTATTTSATPPKAPKPASRAPPPLKKKPQL